MDGKSEVWTCSLTRFAWHSLLFRSWIACIGLSLLLIVSFFEDCYRCRCIELADNGDPISLGGLPCTLILTARIGPVYQLIAVGRVVRKAMQKSKLQAKIKVDKKVAKNSKNTGS